MRILFVSDRHEKKCSFTEYLGHINGVLEILPSLDEDRNKVNAIFIDVGTLLIDENGIIDVHRTLKNIISKILNSGDIIVLDDIILDFLPFNTEIFEMMVNL